MSRLPMQPPLSELEAQVERFTVVPRPGSAPPRTILVVAPPEPLERAFAVARRMLKRGPLRLVAHGVTCSTSWPAWVKEVPSLWLTELGAYKFRAAVGGTAHLRDALREWVDAVAKPFGDRSASHVLWQAAAARFFQKTLDAHVLAEGLRLVHRSDRITIHGAWEGAPLVAPRHRAADHLQRVSWPMSVALASGVALAGTFVTLTRQHVRASGSRRRLRALRSTRPDETPTLWIAAIPDFARVNKHVIESVVEPARREGRRFGVLLIGNLDPDSRVDHDLRKRSRSAMWSGLGPLNELLPRVVTEQCVGAESTRTFAVDLTRSTLRALFTTYRIATCRPEIVAQGIRYPIHRELLNIARFATLDQARAAAAYHAARRFLHHRDMRGAAVISCASAAPGIAGADVALQQAGATTIEVFHGTGGDYWHGAAETASTLRCVWSNVDERFHRESLHGVLVGGMPRPAPCSHRRPPSRNVLVMTNLVHRDTGAMGYPLRPFQRDLLAALRPIARAGRFSLRWRPHPADVERLVREDQRLAPELDLSRGRPLSEDLEWADIVISNQSTALVEALCAGLPVLAHLYPEQLVATEYLHPARTFFRGEDLAPLLVGCAARIDAGSADALAPDQYALERLFGPNRGPRPFPFDEIVNLRAS